MKKIIFSLCLFVILFYSGCNKNMNEDANLVKKVMYEVTFETKVSSDLELPTSKNGVLISWQSNCDSITNEGKVTFKNTSQKVILTGTFKYKKVEQEKKFEVEVISLKEKFEPYINEKIESLVLPKEYKTPIYLPSSIDDVLIKWECSLGNIVDGFLNVNLSMDEQIITLKAKFSYHDVLVEKEYEIKAAAISTFEFLRLVADDYKESYELGKNELKDEIKALGVSLECSFSPSDVVDENGLFIKGEEEKKATIVLKFKKDDVVFQDYLNIVIPSLSHLEKLEKMIADFKLIEATKEDVVLPLNHKEASISWKSKTITFIDNLGNIKRGTKDRNAKLEATFSYLNEEITKEFTILIYKYTDLELIELALSMFEMPIETSVDLILPDYLDYEVEITWKSSNPLVLDNSGLITRQNQDVLVDLIATLKKGSETKEMTYSVKVLKKQDPKEGKAHQIVVRAKTFNDSFDGTEILGEKLVLSAPSLSGSYESNEISTIAFSSLVASWASTSSTKATAELFVKAYVNGKWSDYITYHPWGFGLNNKCYDQNNGVIRLLDDEVKVISGVATKLMFKVVLKRSALTDESPKLSLVSFALQSNSYSYDVDLTSIPLTTVHNVPRLYQGEVPEIGNSICSPTTSTMLLKYKGEDFSAFDVYEHRYIAHKFREYNSMIFGNWVYNTVGISSFGYDAYVARMYSIDELVYHLATVGPCGLSVKGQMTSNEKDYYTQGHLIVAIGYRYENDKLYIICNDPNVGKVLCEYTEEVMQKTWRMVAYVVE